MTSNTTTLPSGAAAHALERARIAELRRAIAQRIDADLALLDGLARRTAAATGTLADACPADQGGLAA